MSVIGYMLFLEPSWRCLACLLPAADAVRAAAAAGHQPPRATRILTKRGISGDIVATAAASTHEWAWAKEPIERVFTLNMGIYKLKYSMNMLMNLMHHSSVAVALCVGGWLALEGRIEVGTVVAMVGGLGKLNDPWGDLVNWAREFSVVSVKYRLFADVVNRILGFSTPSLRPGWWQWRRT